MKKKDRGLWPAGWLLLVTLAACCIQMFQPAVTKAAGATLKSKDGLWQYELKEEAGTVAAVVDGYYGQDRNLVIPEEIDGYAVKYIGRPSGWNTVKTDRFDSITIPDSVAGVANTPFFTHSHNLQYLSIGKNYGVVSPKDINMLKSDDTYDIQAREYRVSPENGVLTAVDGVLYSKDMRVLKLYPSLKEDAAFTVPDGAVSIDNYAMNNLKYLKSLVLPNGLTKIGAYCCKGASIHSVQLPDSLTELDHGVFYGSKLTSIVLPDSITKIGGYVFTGTPLEKVVIPDTLVSLGDGDFMDCTKLKSIEIGSGLSSIGGNCFYGLTALETFRISEGNQSFKSEGGMLLTKDGSTLIQYAAAGNAEFTLPKGVTVIGPNACYGMPFQKIVVPDTVVAIGDKAFENCTKAGTAYIPSSVTSLGGGVFFGCASLKTVVLDAKVTKVASSFQGCDALTEITLPETLASIADSVFFGKSLRSVYLKPQKAPSISYTTYIQGEDAKTELIKKSSNVQIFVPENAQGYDALPWSRMHIVHGDAVRGDTVTEGQLTLNPSSLILRVGETASVQAAVSPQGAAAADVVFETSNEKVVSVNNSGQVTALAAGTANIRASAGTLFAECMVTVSAGQGQAGARNFRLETSGGTASSNYNAQNYMKWSKPMKSYLFADGEGLLTRVEFIDGKLVYEAYGTDGTLKKSGSIADELPLVGGFYASGAYRFVVYGQANSAGSDSAEVVRIVKYGQGWNRIASCSLYGENTKKPFDAGSLRFAEYGGILYIRTSHLMYDGHQSNLQVAVDMSAMKITDTFSAVANIRSGGYVSHSFNQFLKMDGADLVTLDHGDSYPRAAVLIKYPNIPKATFAKSSVEYINALSFSGQTGNNNTGASLGGLELSGQTYIFAGNYANHSGSSVRNIFVNITGKDFLKNPAARMVYLTDFGANSGVTVSTPQLVKVNEKTFLVLWNETDASKMSVHSQMIDENGNKIAKEQTFHGSLSDCQPIIQNGQAVWYYTGTEKGKTAPIFCRISVDGSETVDNLPNAENGQAGDADGKARTIFAGNVSLSQTSYTYDGKAKTPAVTVKDGSKTLVKNTDYTVTYSNNVQAGTAKVTVTGKGNYTGTVTKEFTIKKESASTQAPAVTQDPVHTEPSTSAQELSKCTITLSQVSYAYDGKAKMPAVTAKDGTRILKAGTDYTVAYSSNVQAGTAKVTVTGKGAYTGTVTKSYTIQVKKGWAGQVGSCQYKVTGASAVSLTGLSSSRVTKVTVPETVDIGGKVFKVTAIGSNAFKDNQTLTGVAIGKNVTAIGASAFKNCRKLGGITIKAANLKKVGKNALKGIKATAKIKVPVKKLPAYKKLLKGKGQGKKVKILRS